MKILTHDDLLEALDHVYRRHDRFFFWTRIALFAVMTGVAAYHGRKADRLEGELVAKGVALEETRKLLTETRNELNGLKSAMTVSIDARRLGRPVRLSGEMIVVFAGTVKEDKK